MRDPLSITFDLLTVSDHPAAGDLLIEALDVPIPRIVGLAAAALARRAAPRGHLELIRRCQRFPPAVRTTIARYVSSVQDSLRRALLHGDDEIRVNALEVLRWVRDFALIGTLVTVLEDASHPARDLAADVLDELCDHLSDHLHGRGEGSPPRDLPRVVDQVVRTLDEAAARGRAHRLESVVDGILILTDVEHSAFKRLLRRHDDACGTAAERRLRHSTRPGVMQKLIDMLSMNYPPSGMRQIIEERRDVEFLAAWLRSWPRRPTHAWEENVRQIESLAWLDDPDLAVLSQLPPALLGRLVDLVQQVGIASEQRTRVIEWVLKHGPADARDRAAETLEQQHSDYVADLVARELNSPDAEIQAWATSQLRAHAVPNAFEELIHRLDSPIAEVREAARKELDDFNVKRLLELHDQIPPAVCRQAGELLLKIHPEALSELRHELTHPIRSKKLRAARCVAAAGLQEPLIEGLAAMLDDDDVMVRRAAVEALGTCRHPLTATLLARMTHDASPRVRTAAESALAQLAASAPAGDQGKAPPHPQEPSSWPIPTVS